MWASDIDESRFEQRHDHCDVLVIGAGPAGIAAARAASSAGLRVLLADDQPRAGGSLLWRGAEIDGLSGPAWVANAMAGFVTNPRARMLHRTTAVAYFDHNLIALVEQRESAAAGWAPERLWKIRAKQVILATGAIERPLVFPQNDRPGVMSAAAVSQYLRRWGVLPYLPAEGGRAVVFTNNDGAYDTARDLLAAGAHVTIVDLHRPMSQELIDRMRSLGVEMRSGFVIVDVRGRSRVRAVRIAAMNDPAGPRETIPCDLVAVSGGWTPTIHLHSQSGGTNRYDKYLGAFLPDRVTQAQRSIGAARGLLDLGGVPGRRSRRRQCRGRSLRRCAEGERLQRRRAEARHQHSPLLAGGPAEVAPVGRLHERRHRQGCADRGARELHLGGASEALHHAGHGDRPGQDQQPEWPRHPGPGDRPLDSGSRHHHIPPALCTGIPRPAERPSPRRDVFAGAAPAGPSRA